MAISSNDSYTKAIEAMKLDLGLSAEQNQNVPPKRKMPPLSQSLELSQVKLLHEAIDASIARQANFISSPTAATILRNQVVANINSLLALQAVYAGYLNEAKHGLYE